MGVVLSASELQGLVDQLEDNYVLHRHDGNHIEGVECWCYPLALTGTQIAAHTTKELQELLNTHYRIH